MKEINALFAGFGGQGIQFMSKILAYAGLYADRQVSWMPSYGPEMRGGTCNCGVCISDDPICSPLVTTPNVFVAMNKPSFEKFISDVEPGGIVIIDSTLIDNKVERDDVEVHYVPATSLAEEKGMKGMANMIIMGKMMAVTGVFTLDDMKKTFAKIIPPKKAHLIDKNMEAVALGAAL